MIWSAVLNPETGAPIAAPLEAPVQYWIAPRTAAPDAPSYRAVGAAPEKMRRKSEKMRNGSMQVPEGKMLTVSLEILIQIFIDKATEL